MDTHALIIEQLEWNGILKSFTLEATPDLGKMWVAYPDEYEDERTGAFHFLDEGYENLFEQKLAKCRNAKLPNEKFNMDGDNFHFTTTWNNIPTKSGHLTFYSLYLPEFAVPDEVHILDTFQKEKEFKKVIYRDDPKNRYIVFLECRSKVGIFNFRLHAKFHKDTLTFNQSKYNDNNTIGFNEGEPHVAWEYLLAEKEADKVHNFFAAPVIFNTGGTNQQTINLSNMQKNNPWISGSFYLIAAVIILSLLLVAAKMISIIALPIIIIGGLIIFSVIGAYQLRNDEKLSEKSFLELMQLSFKQIPFIRSNKK
jgi:hypothetical protein